MNWYRIQSVLTPALFLLPGIGFTLVLKYYPILKAIQLSFYDYDLRNPPGRFIGFQNFTSLFRDSSYWNSWQNTIVFLFLTYAIVFAIPILQALFLEQITWFREGVSTIYILPAVIPGIVTVVLWKWIWHPTYGAANYLLGLLGLPAQTWLSNIELVKFAIVFPGIIGGGLGVLIYLAAIYGISEDVKEAAELDGCTGFSRIWYIILPNIRFLIFINFVLATIGALQMLDSIFQFTNGGPAQASESVPLFIYHQYMFWFDYGRASAASLTLMFVIAVVTFFQLWLNSRNADE